MCRPENPDLQKLSSPNVPNPLPGPPTFEKSRLGPPSTGQGKQNLAAITTTVISTGIGHILAFVQAGPM